MLRRPLLFSLRCVLRRRSRLAQLGIKEKVNGRFIRYGGLEPPPRKTKLSINMTVYLQLAEK